MRRIGRCLLSAAGLLVLAACSAASPTATGEPTTTAAATTTASPTATASPEATATAEATAEPTPAPPAAWVELTSTDGPAAREDHVWRVDTDGTTAYLFGGRDGTAVFDDLWAYDLDDETWTELAPEGATPGARFGHEAAWVEDIGLVIFAGQRDASTFFNDVWSYDPGANAWEELPAGGAVPAARYGSCAAIGPDGRLWMSHGFTADTGRFFDTRAYDLAAGAWTDETPTTGDPPVVRCLHACWWTDTGSLVLFGGQTTGVTALGDLWRLRLGDGSGGHAWAQVEGDVPSERNLYAATRTEGATLVFGGQALDGTYLNDAWRFDDPANGAQPVPIEGDAPPGRSGGELIHDAEGGRVLLFGGRDASGAFDDLWELPLAD
jgi:hypothetical protein